MLYTAYWRLGRMLAECEGHANSQPGLPKVQMGSLTCLETAQGSLSRSAPSPHSGSSFSTYHKFPRPSAAFQKSQSLRAPKPSKPVSRGLAGYQQGGYMPNTYLQQGLQGQAYGQQPAAQAGWTSNPYAALVRDPHAGRGGRGGRRY